MMWWFVCVAAVFACACAYGTGSDGSSQWDRVDPLRSRALPPVDQAMIADLAMAALGSGASIPAVLEALHQALGEEDEPSGLDTVSKLLMMGEEWDMAWQSVSERFDPLRIALEPSWVDGAAAVPLLARSAATIRQGRARRAKESAAELGSRLVLPLGLCFLPAFLLLGVVPVIASAGMMLFTP